MSLSTCQCLTRDGKGPPCTRSVKAGEMFCFQHKKGCVKQKNNITPASASTSTSTSVTQGTLETLSDPEILMLCQDMMKRQEFKVLSTLVQTNKHFRDLCQPILSQAKPIDPPAWDRDKQSPIPDSLKKYKYLYVSGSQPDDFQRYWILPSDWKVVASFLNGGGQFPTLTLGELARMNPNAYRYLQFEPVMNIAPFFNDILPVSPRTLRGLLLTRHIYNPINPRVSIAPQIRRNGKILEQLPMLTYEESVKIDSDQTLTTLNQIITKMKNFK